MSPGGPTVRILLIDDDPVILRGYGQRLRAEGWEVTTAADGYEALTAAQSKTWDLILLDLRIPYRNGVEVLRLLRQRKETAATVVWVLAQPGDADFVDRAMREGADGVFEKARLGPRDIALEITRILESQRRTPAPRSALGTAAVPSAVDEIAKRLRKPDAPVAPPSVRQPGWSAGPHVRAGSGPSSVNRSLGASQANPAQTQLPPYGVLDDEDDAPTSRPAAGAATVHLPAAQTQSGHSYASPAAAAAGAAFDAAVSQAPASFDTLLNRMVGQSAALAGALGLSADFTCPVCQTQLVLRLSPDPSVDNGVRGHFYCGRCTAPR